MMLNAQQLYKMYIFLNGLDELTARTGVVALAAGHEYVELDGDLLKVRVMRESVTKEVMGGPEVGITVTYAIDTSN